VLVDLAGNEPRDYIPFWDVAYDLTIYLRENQFTGVAEALCEKAAWMDGEVGIFGCDAILCANGTFNFIESAEAGKCVKCPKARGWALGVTGAQTHHIRQPVFSMGYKLLGLS
jgi:hypothetical protein